MLAMLRVCTFVKIKLIIGIEIERLVYVSVSVYNNNATFGLLRNYFYEAYICLIFKVISGIMM